MTERMDDYSERVQEGVAKGEIVTRDQQEEMTATERQARHRNALRTEEDITEGLRVNAARAVEIEAELLERAASARDRDVPQALRAVSDVKAKSLDGLLKITGRAASPEEDGNLVRMIDAMSRKGYLRVRVDMGTGTPPDDQPE